MGRTAATQELGGTGRPTGGGHTPPVGLARCPDSAMMVVRPYDDARYGASLFALWGETLGDSWPLTAAQFRRTLAVAERPGGQYFVARGGADLLGFAAIQVSQDAASGTPTGALPLLLVAPTVQRRGIGTALHGHTLGALRVRGVARAVAGDGSPRFWPGIPAASNFFAARGWHLAERSHYLVRDLRRPPTNRNPRPQHRRGSRSGPRSLRRSRNCWRSSGGSSRPIALRRKLGPPPSPRRGTSPVPSGTRSRGLQPPEHRAKHSARRFSMGRMLRSSASATTTIP